VDQYRRDKRKMRFQPEFQKFIEHCFSNARNDTNDGSYKKVEYYKNVQRKILYNFAYVTIIL
jgi:hypothetical protein